MIFSTLFTAQVPGLKNIELFYIGIQLHVFIDQSSYF